MMRDWVWLINCMSLQALDMVLNVCLKYSHSHSISSQLIIFLCILCVCVYVCAQTHTHTHTHIYMGRGGGWQAHQLLRLFAHVGRIKNPEHTYPHLRDRQAKTEMSESKKSDVCHLLTTGCQMSFNDRLLGACHWNPTIHVMEVRTKAV
jgi:hypothetical protein